MRFLDVDLDFFLNDNPYHIGSDSGRLGSEYKPWPLFRVRSFLEKRCDLSRDAPIPGRTVEEHDTVIDFWISLIESGDLHVPFEIVHIDAHPDLSVQSGLYLQEGLLRIDPKFYPVMLEREEVHSGNYLTFALEKGWVASLVWVTLPKAFGHLPVGYGEAKDSLRHFHRRKVLAPPTERLSAAQTGQGIPFEILPWHKFRTSKRFDYMALSRSPNFTPPESDALVPVIMELLQASFVQVIGYACSLLFLKLF